MGSEGRASEAPKPTMLMMTITIKPIYWPRVILRGVTVLLVDASEKNVTKTNMSSILVMANEIVEGLASAIDFPPCYWPLGMIKPSPAHVGTERAIRTLSDSYKKHSHDIQEFVAIQQQFSELKQECAAKDEEIRMQKDGIAALTDLSRERDEELKQRREDITKEKNPSRKRRKALRSPRRM
jgi:hypothetical protein